MITIAIIILVLFALYLLFRFGFYILDFVFSIIGALFSGGSSNDSGGGFGGGSSGGGGKGGGRRLYYNNDIKPKNKLKRRLEFLSETYLVDL